MASEAWPAPTTPALRPVRVERPRDIDDVAGAVRTAVRDGLTVRPVGAGSTASGLTVTDGVVLDLTGLDRVRSVDPASRTAVVEAGIRLSRLWPLLWEHGLTIEGPGGLDQQTLGGAIATGEHGSGLRYGGLASRVLALEMVLADGTLMRCSSRTHPDLFQAARVGLGAFGVVTAVTLACDPAREIEVSVLELPADTFLDDADDLVERFDHVEFGWRPDIGQILCTTASPAPAGGAPVPEGPAAASLPVGGPPGEPGGAVPDAPAAPPADVPGTGDAPPEHGPGTGPGGQPWAVRFRRGRAGLGRLPGLTGRTPGLPGVRMIADRGYRVFGRRPRGHGREIEYAVPRACFPAVFEEMRERMRQHPVPSGSVRVRFGAAEDAWLALGQGRETAYLCATAGSAPALAAFASVLGAVAARYDGRPHWGRPHGLGAEVLRARYPRFDDARAVRDRVDPRRVFASLYLDRLLGT